MHMQVWVFCNDGVHATCCAFRGTEQVEAGLAHRWGLQNPCFWCILVKGKDPDC